VHVTYGLVGLKTHTKTALVVRDEGDGVRSYCHIGTGNYNAKTAKLYEDLGILTADPLIGADLAQLFNFLTGYGREVNYRRLLVAPHSLRNRVYELIEREMDITAGGHTVMKMNSLVDPGMIDHLYAASQAGVSIDLIVRGICCLRPGVPGLSDNIRVRSLIGRNLDRRVEALVPVLDPAIARRVQEILEVELSDDTLAWTLGPDASWTRVADHGRGGTIDAHLRFQELALTRAGRTPPDS
jgi:polyphosphate kinase